MGKESWGSRSKATSADPLVLPSRRLAVWVRETTRDPAVFEYPF